MASNTDEPNRDKDATLFSGGATFGHFRLSLDRPQKNLTTVSDRVAARLMNYLGNEDAAWDLSASNYYTKLLPVRISESAALRDCVAVMCSAWTNFRRNRAVHDPVRQLTCETLAAATIMERLEILFDTHRPYHRTRHSLGIQGLMSKRGPPKLKDDLDIQLALENHAALLNHWIVEGGENFYLSSPWKEVIEKMLENHVPPGERMDCYSIGRYFGYRPGLIREMGLLYNNPNEISRFVQAAELQDRVAYLIAEIERTSEPIMAKALITGRIRRRARLRNPVGEKLHFASLDSFQFFMSYVLIRIILNRILYELTAMLGQPYIFLDEVRRDLRHQVWMCIPFVRGLGKIGCTLFAAPLHMAYEGVSEFEREQVVGVFILNSARAASGRMSFDTAIPQRSTMVESSGASET
ncbi:hypothetical protein AAE478_005047 [Parahypoxylon ruwenzoriense]